MVNYFDENELTDDELEKVVGGGTRGPSNTAGEEEGLPPDEDAVSGPGQGIVKGG